MKLCPNDLCLMLLVPGLCGLGCVVHVCVCVHVHSTTVPDANSNVGMNI